MSGIDEHDLEVMRRSPLFSRLSADQARTLVSPSIPRAYAKGTVLFQQGDAADCFYVVLDGVVKIARHLPDGDEVVIGVVGPGATVAEVAMFIGGRYPATAEIVADARLLPVRSSHFRAALRDNADLAMGLLAATAQRVHALVQELEHIKSQTSAQRVADFLVGLCPGLQGTDVEIELPYEKGLIAARLGMTPESFSRALRRLRQLGVRIRRDHVFIPSVELLNHFAMSGEDGGPPGGT